VSGKNDYLVKKYEDGEITLERLFREQDEHTMEQLVIATVIAVPIIVVMAVALIF